MKILFLSAIFLLITSFFIPRVLTGLLGLLLVIFASIVYGLKGGFLSSTWATMISVITIFIQGYQTSTLNQIISISIYFLIGVSLGKVIDIVQEKKEELKEKKNLLEGIINSIPDILAVQNPDQSIEFYNQAGYEVLGIDEAEAKGEKCYHLLGKNKACDNCPSKKTLESKEREMVQKYIPGLDKYFECISKPILNDAGEVVRIVEHLKDISKFKETELELKKTKNMYSNLAEQIPGTIYQYQYFPDGSSCFPFASEGIYDVYEVKPEEVENDATPAFERIHKQDYQRVTESIKKSARELTTWQDEYRVNLPNKGLRWLEGIAKPEQLADGSVLWHGHIRDITERKEIENKMKEAVKKAKAANKAKSEFLANMSHEIRTPLNAVIGFSQILEDQLKEAIHKNYLNSIQKASYSLLNLINDILDMSKIEAEMLKVEFDYFDLESLLEEMRVIFKQKVTEKGLDYILEEDIVFSEIKLDETRLRQILINLISNAIKFTSEGYVKIIVKQIIKDNDRLDLELIVEDTGIGISQNNQAKIFEAFTQHDGQSTREYEGTGLGLTITKELTELLGGEIELESRLGEGSKFKLSFSGLEFRKEKAGAAQKNKLKNIEFEKAEVLVVDDVESNRKFLKIKLENKGLEITEAKNGKEALNLFKDKDFDLIIMDLKMPVMDGYQALKELKNISYNKPVIAFTASATQKEKKKVKSAGFDSFITKPISSDKLYKNIKKYLTYQIKTEVKKEEKKNEIDLKQMKIDKEIITKLEKDFLVESKKIKDAIIINEVEEFIERLYKFGQLNDLEIITNYTVELENALNSFNLEKIEEKLLEFEDLIKKLKGMYEGRLTKDEK